jgi:glycosyltransferase involved in cell wall biosynthesis
MSLLLVDLTMCFGRGRAEIHGGGEYGKAAAAYLAATLQRREVVALVRAGTREAARAELGERVAIREVDDGPLDRLPAELDDPGHVLFLPLPAHFLERGPGCAARLVAVEHGLRDHEKAHGLADHLCHPLLDDGIWRRVLCARAGQVRKRRLGRANRRYARRLGALKRDDVLVAPSRHTRSALRLEFGGPQGAAGARVAHDALVLPPLAPFLDPPEADFEGAREGVLLLSANRPVKNVERFLEGVDRYEPARAAAGRMGIDLVGTDAASRRYLERRFGGRLALRMHPYVDRERLQALIRGAEVFVFPSLSEGYGIPPVQAFAHGTPVIASGTTAVAEVAADAALLADPWSPGELANRFLQLAEDPALARALAEAGPRRYASLRAGTLDAWQGFARWLDGSGDAMPGS